MSPPLTPRFLGFSTTAALLCAALLVACERREPPGARAEPSRPRIVGSGEGFAAGPKPATSAGGKAPVPGSIDDNLPFEPTGLRIASIAWRTWIYTDTGPKRSRYGYLRAGRVVDARGPAIVNDGCEGGWYRINPRGFV